MGGRRRSSSSSSRSFFSRLFRFSARPRCHHDVDEVEPKNKARVWASDEDRGRWVGDPYIDRKATEYITKFHETRFTDPEWQTVNPLPS